MKTFLKFGLLVLALAGISLSASAIIFYSTGEVSYNTAAPDGALDGSGWQFQGRFNSYLGTPVGPHHFLAAKHIGGSVGNKFYYGSEVFTTVGKVEDAGSDLIIWEVSERFTSYAPLYSSTDEAGKGLVVFGRGVDRGAAVTNTITSGFGPWRTTEVMTNGWKWGAYNYTQRWGENAVSGTATINGYPVLKADWDPDAGTNECMLADKDSSGGVFIQEAGVWKLAGINYSVGPAATYSFNSDGSDSFKAAILDFSGDDSLYYDNGVGWVPLLSTQKSSFYASRISSRYSWITNNVSDFDQDVDLMPDWWESEYGDSATEMVAAVDGDGDGFTNLEEWIADTDPTDSNSFWQVEGMITSSDQTFSFDGSTARQYQLLYTTSGLADPGLTWITNGTPIWGAGEGTEIAVTNTEEMVFYRVQAILP